MNYRDAGAFRTALEARLNRAADPRDQAMIVHLRKTVVFDRLLARLVVVAPGRWVVKGGVSLNLRLGDRSRRTRDLDLARGDTRVAAMADLQAAAAADLGDFFDFAVVETSALDALEEGVAIRYHVQAELAKRRFEYVVLDIGLGVPLPAVPDQIAGADLLTFAGIEPIRLPALPLDVHVAEKLHAYTRPYPPGRQNTRVKDLIDLVIISATQTFDAAVLAGSIQTTFTVRGTQAVPSTLPPPPASWLLPYRRLADEVRLAPDVATGHRLAAAFLDGVLDGSLPDDATWDPTAGEWRIPTR